MNSFSEVLAVPGARNPDPIIDQDEGDRLDPQLCRAMQPGLDFRLACGTHQERTDTVLVHSCFASQGGEGVQTRDVPPLAPVSSI